MADLLALGTNPEHRWRRTLPSAPVTLGRSALKSDWVVPWDPQISRLHATLVWQDGRLNVCKESNALNKIIYGGQPLDTCSVPAGERFIIGGTTFVVQEGRAADERTAPTGIHPPLSASGATPTPPDSPSGWIEFSCSPKELQQIQYEDANERIAVLATLPEMIRYSLSDHDLKTRVVDVLLRGIPRAEVAAIVRLNPRNRGEDYEVEILSANRRDGEALGFHASRRLAFDAIHRRRQSVLHIWQGGDSSGEFTIGPNLDWVICTPLPDEPSPGLALYVAGLVQNTMILQGSSQEKLLKSDLKFTELVADIYGALQQVCHLQQQHAHLAGFLSRPVLSAIAQRDMDEVLRPLETEVSVLFCDLRGSCRIAEESQNELASLWDRVSEALSIMTNSIIDRDGVIGDFQGDAAMGFWGWPLAYDNQIERATRAALTIRQRFARASQKAGNPLAGFNCGIGIAKGQAIAGRLGTFDQFKVSVYGPVVNLAARLESMTKIFRVPILVDEPTAEFLNGPTTSHWARCRRVARVKPFGMTTVLTVSELLPPAVEPSALSERDRLNFEAAFDAFANGQWADARRILQRLQNDGPSDFLMTFMDRHRVPPEDWDGVIVMDTK